VGCPSEAAGLAAAGSKPPSLALVSLPSRSPLLACLDPFEDVDELEPGVIIVVTVGLKHLNQLQ
jgi:hypothetical protein